MRKRRFGDDVVGDPVRELRERVRRQRRDHEEIRARQVEVNVLGRRAAGEGAERVGTDEPLSARSEQRHDLVSRPYE